MKKIITILFMLFILTFIFMNVVDAGNQWSSEQDQIWEITVDDCKGNITIYKDCLIINDNRFNNLVFMPNQGRIPTGNGTVVKILRSACTDITIISK